MKTAPILFSGPLVRAIIEGQKTQTRRLPKVQPPPCFRLRPDHDRSTAAGDAWRKAVGAHAPGTLLWVRETTRLHLPNGGRFDDGDYIHGDPVEIEYIADGERRVAMPAPTWRVPGVAFKGQPLVSIHMPRWAARLFLRVIEVRLERLQAITDDDIRAEGLPGAWPTLPGETLREQWTRGWNAINAGWDANPWVIAYTFERAAPLAPGDRVRFCDARPTAPPDLGTLYDEGGRLHVRWDMSDGEEVDEVDPLTGDILGGIQGRVERVEGER